MEKLLSCIITNLQQPSSSGLVDYHLHNLSWEFWTHFHKYALAHFSYLPLSKDRLKKSEVQALFLGEHIHFHLVILECIVSCDTMNKLDRTYVTVLNSNCLHRLPANTTHLWNLISTGTSGTMITQYTVMRYVICNIHTIFFTPSDICPNNK